MSSAWTDVVSERNREATVHRKRGDALRRSGDHDKAEAEFSAGLKVLDEALRVLQDPRWYRLGKLSVNPLPNDQLQLATELVEVWGARGGLLRRLGNAREALESYKAGSDVESRFVPNSTYNRVNAIKFALLSGLRTLTDIEGEIRTFEHLLTDALAKDQKLSDSGWAWADLADCRALIGDVAGAERAYRTFVQKAGSKAPDATLDVLYAILAKLRDANDPRAAAVDASITALKQRLS